MAAAIGAIKGFLHYFTDDLSKREGHALTILDVLEPRRPQG